MLHKNVYKIYSEEAKNSDIHDDKFAAARARTHTHTYTHTHIYGTASTRTLGFREGPNCVPAFYPFPYTPQVNRLVSKAPCSRKQVIIMIVGFVWVFSM